MKKIYLCIIFLVSFLPLFVFSAPEPWGIAINQKTKECTAFWGGDEYIIISLADNWKDYYPSSISSNTGEIINTENGFCNFTIGKEKECCQQLGLLYVKNSNFKRQETELRKQKNSPQVVQNLSKQNSGNFYYQLFFAIIIIASIGLFIGFSKFSFNSRK